MGLTTTHIAKIYYLSIIVPHPLAFHVCHRMRKSSWRSADYCVVYDDTKLTPTHRVLESTCLLTYAPPNFTLVAKFLRYLLFSKKWRVCVKLPRSCKVSPPYGTWLLFLNSDEDEMEWHKKTNKQAPASCSLQEHYK